MNHPLSHTADGGHTLFGKDSDNDYYAGDAIGGSLRKETRVNDDGSSMRRTLSNKGASSMANGNKEHSRHGSMYDTGRRASLNVIPTAATMAHIGNLTAAKASRTLFTETDSADTDGPVVTRGTAVQQDLSDPVVSLEWRESTPPPQQRRTSVVRQHVRARTVSTPTPRSKPLEFLPNLGPLEISRKIDSGVHLGSDHEQEEDEEPTVVALPQQTLDARITRNSVVDPLQLASPSTHISESSQSSQSTAGESISTMRTTDRGTDDEGSMKHPLLMDLTAEPESLDDDSFHARGETPPPSYVQGRHTMHRKGHTMGPGSYQGSDQETDAHASKANDDDSDWTDDSQVGTDQNGRTMTESVGKRVIIHQVAVTDTLAGIALCYGVQVSILKKYNKLWTNDSIHTRKYLYIPFEESVVAQQAAVMVDEKSQVVVLPHKVQYQHHGRSRSAWADAGRPSSAEPAGPRYGTQGGMPAIGELASGTTAMGTSINSDSVMNSRLVAWIDPKSTAAPAVSSPTMTSTSRTSDKNLKAAPLSPRRAATTIESSFRTTALSTGSAPFSENLPNTVVVAPSMTHEALAARFKEMGMVTSEQQRKMNQQQELRSIPVHQRRRTTDLRHFAHMKSSSNAGSRRTSLDIGRASDPSMITGLSGKRASTFDRQSRGEGHLTINEEDMTQDQQNNFVAYGSQQHIYDPDNLNSGGGLVGVPGDGSEDAESTILLKQELVTVPAGMLSFFPSPEHSRKLETPESISRLQDRMESYHSSISSASSSSGSFRGVLPDKSGGRSKKTRAALDDQTFQSPSSTSNATSSPVDGAESSSAASTTSVSRTAQSKTVRVHQSYYSAQKWSMMGESLVDDILGAVRGPLQIARRVYNNFTTMNFTDAIGSSFSRDNQDHFDPPSLRRRSSARSRPRVGQRNTEYRHASESFIELDQTECISSRVRSNSGAGSPSVTFADIGASRYSSITKRIPTSPVTLTGTLGPERNNADSSSTSDQGQVSHKKSISKGSSGHYRVSSSGSTHGSRKRSLRSQGHISRAALMALVNEMDKDMREKEQGVGKEQEKGTQNTFDNSSDSVSCKGIKSASPPGIVDDLLAPPL
ncbi:hypothetical protein BGX31_011338 [Mortierella sp. GBA43]|nr:hypothetical protein BGX31_011338 [Mortierella sp. GBA43]